jgi:hypothetical protein
MGPRVHPDALEKILLPCWESNHDSLFYQPDIILIFDVIKPNSTQGVL